MGFLFLDENEVDGLLAAAREGQAAKLEFIEKVEEGLNESFSGVDEDYYDVSDLRHFQAEHDRTTRLIDEIEKRLTFSLVDDKSVPIF